MSNFEGCVFLSKVRLSFPNLAVPRAPQGSDKLKYSADFILAPNDPNYAKFVALAHAVAQQKWPQHHAAVLQAIHGERKKRCFGNGSEKIDSTTYKVLNGYEGMVYISGSRNSDKGMPQMIDVNNQAIDPSNALACQNEARKMYGGCYVNAVIKPWVYDNQFGKGIGGDLIAVQFAAEGAPFGEGVTDASAMFGAPVVGGGHAPGFASLAMPGYAPAPQFPPVGQVAPKSPWG